MTQCPLWVKSGHVQCTHGMSAKCQKRTLRSQSDFCRYGGKHVVGRQGSTDAFELKFADWFDAYSSSTAIKTRGLMRICPGLASSQSRDATLDTVPMAA